MYWVKPPTFARTKVRVFLNQSLNHAVYLFFFFILNQNYIFAAMNKTLVFITIGLIGAYVVKKISMAKKLSYSFAGIQLSSQILSSNVYIKINVTNPTSTTSTIKNIVGDLFFNGVNIGTCITDKKFFIAANATTKIEVICNVKNIAVLSSLFVAISQKKGLFTFKGFITADGFRLPLNFDYSL